VINLKKQTKRMMLNKRQINLKLKHDVITSNFPRQRLIRHGYFILQQRGMVLLLFKVSEILLTESPEFFANGFPNIYYKSKLKTNFLRLIMVSTNLNNSLKVNSEQRLFTIGKQKV
jgi:hypothetical protein